MRKIFGVLAALCFVGVLGTVAADEQNMLSLAEFVIYSILNLGGFVLFTRLAGGFGAYHEESRPRCSRPKGGKRKSSVTVYTKKKGL